MADDFLLAYCVACTSTSLVTEVFPEMYMLMKFRGFSSHYLKSRAFHIGIGFYASKKQYAKALIDQNNDKWVAEINTAMWQLLCCIEVVNLKYKRSKR